MVAAAVYSLRHIPSPTISNCVFQSGRANKGGGLSLWYASPTVTDCIFRWNGGENFGGAGSRMVLDFDLLRNCILSTKPITLRRGNIPCWWYARVHSLQPLCQRSGSRRWRCQSDVKLSCFRSTIIAYSEGNGISLFESPKVLLNIAVYMETARKTSPIPTPPIMRLLILEYSQRPMRTQILAMTILIFCLIHSPKIQRP